MYKQQRGKETFLFRCNGIFLMQNSFSFKLRIKTVDAQNLANFRQIFYITIFKLWLLKVILSLASKNLVWNDY